MAFYDEDAMDICPPSPSRTAFSTAQCNPNPPNLPMNICPPCPSRTAFSTAKGKPNPPNLRFSTKQERSGGSRCTSANCPIPYSHASGLYLHNWKSPREEDAMVFGGSNPPGFCWKAYERCAKGVGTENDLRIIQTFREIHGNNFDPSVWAADDERRARQLQQRDQGGDRGGDRGGAYQGGEHWKSVLWNNRGGEHRGGGFRDGRGGREGGAYQGGEHWESAPGNNRGEQRHGGRREREGQGRGFRDGRGGREGGAYHGGKHWESAPGNNRGEQRHGGRREREGQGRGPGPPPNGPTGHRPTPDNHFSPFQSQPSREQPEQDFWIG